MKPIDTTRGDRLVRELLAPLERVQPVTLPVVAQQGRRSRKPLLVAVAVGAAILVGGGLALASAFGPLHGATLQPAPPNLSLPKGQIAACRLIGQPAAKVADSLTQNGYQIEWRFQHWGSNSAASGNSTTPSAVSGGYTTAPASVPADSVVSDITPDESAQNKLFVFVQAPNDPDAPTIAAPSCPTNTGS